VLCREFDKTVRFFEPILSGQRIYVLGALQLPGLGGCVLEQFVRVHSSRRLGSCGGMEDAAVPSRETSVSRRLCGVSVAGFGQLFNSRGQIFAPVIFRGGVPDVLLRLANCWCGIDHHEFIVAVEQEITGMKVTVKQDGALLRAVAAAHGIGKGDDSILMPAQ
jgi:hypothetical protein